MLPSQNIHARYFIGKRTLIDLENELLRLLNESRGSLLEDAELFNTLKTSKATSLAVQESLQVSETTEVAIDLAREVLSAELMELTKNFKLKFYFRATDHALKGLQYYSLF